MTPICFVDTETDGVHPGRKPWEVALIRQGTDQERVEASACDAVLTYLRLAPDLESSARSLAGRES